MEARLSTERTGGMASGRINVDEFDRDTFLIYCRTYLMQKLYESVPATSECEFRHISGVMSTIESSLYNSLGTESGRILMVNRIYQAFLEIEIEFSREYIYSLVSYLGKYSYKLKEE